MPKFIVEIGYDRKEIQAYSYRIAGDFITFSDEQGNVVCSFPAKTVSAVSKEGSVKDLPSEGPVIG